MNKQKTGFTIIEVVLVLAIAGLIFMMVFLALPALQRGQRDAQRKSDLSRFQEAVVKYQGANRGRLPNGDAVNWENLVINEYIVGRGDEFVDPSGQPAAGNGSGNVGGVESYRLNVANDAGTANHAAAGIPADFNNGSQNIIYIRTSCRCGRGGSDVVCGLGNRKAAFIMRLEGGGFACRDIN